MIDFAALQARFKLSLGGEIMDEMVRIEVIDRSLALASKLFVAVIPLSIILKAIVPGSGASVRTWPSGSACPGWARGRRERCLRPAAKCVVR
jgi:hypothetical protein